MLSPSQCDSAFLDIALHYEQELALNEGAFKPLDLYIRVLRELSPLAKQRDYKGFQTGFSFTKLSGTHSGR